MSSLKPALKRARPALGTILLMRLELPEGAGEAALDEVLGRVFEFCEELEAKFSKFREASDVSRLNQASLERDIPVSREFMELMHLAQDIWRASDGAFAPWENAEFPFVLTEERNCFYVRKTADATLDLSGIAKGYVVDKVAAMIENEIPGIAGVLNAGGDLLFLGAYSRIADIRLAHGTEARRLELDDNAVATSSMSEYLNNEASTTVYSKTPARGLNDSHVVSVVARSCALADALTKVGWFAHEDAALRVAQQFEAKILIFDKAGTICQSFGGK